MAVRRRPPGDGLRPRARSLVERRRLGKATVVHDWRTRHDDFPAPLAKLRMGFVWSWTDVERWAKATGRL